MGHLRSRRGGAILILNHAVVQLGRHCNDHVIEVRIEKSTFRNIQTKWWVVVITSHQIVRVVLQPWIMRSRLGKFWRPHPKIRILGLMHCHVWWPHSIMNNSLSKVPLLEEVTSVLLMTWMNLRKEDHLLHQFGLSESLVH